MNVTHKIKIHLDDQRLLQPIDAVQGDAYTRKLEFSLYAEGKEWEVPEGVTPYVTYRGSGGAGIYCDLNGEPAYEVDGNVITVTLIPQVVAVAGATAVNVMLRDENDKQLSTFSVLLRVAPNPGVGAGKPEDYFDIRQWVGAGPLYVTMTAADNVNCTEAPTYAEISEAKNVGRDVYCVYNQATIMPLINLTASSAIFQVPIGSGADRRVIIYSDQTRVPKISLVEYAFKSDLGDYAKTTDLDSYAKSTDLKPPFYVQLTYEAGANTGSASHSFAVIYAAHSKGQDVMCVINNSHILPLTNISSTLAVFQGPSGTGSDWQVSLGDTWGNEAQLATVEYAGKADLDNYAKTGDLKPPLYVTLTRPETGKNWAASHSFAQIKEAREADRAVLCVLDGRTIVPLIHLTSSMATFQGPATDGTDCRVGMPSFWDKLAQVSVVKYAFEDDLAAYALARNVTDESYFDISVDGVICLKPEYRGNPATEDAEVYPYACSDNGAGMEGSKLSELPEIVIIPQNIDGEEVTGFREGMFCCNQRVKEIVIPVTVKALPNDFAREAIYLEKLTNTEHLESIGTGALQQTRVNEIVCPNLTSLGGDAFRLAYCLRYADLGKITAIPDNAFRVCANLWEVKADHVTSIGKHSFYGTRRLKSLSCLHNVKSMGDGAFWSSRCDLEALPADCGFGTLSSYKQFNPTEYWKGVAFTPCKVPLGSLFSQRDPRWADREIKYTAADGTEYAYLDETGNPCTYADNGCALFTLMAIYSALMGVSFDSPDEFFPVLEDAGMLGKDFRKHSTWIEIANGLGFETEYITSMDAENLKKVYDALADGALLYRSTLGSFPNDTLINLMLNGTVSASNLTQGTHAILGYGINSDGEILTSDTSMHGHKVGIPENHKTAWHIYKHGSELCDCVIVKKPE